MLPNDNGVELSSVPWESLSKSLILDPVVNIKSEVSDIGPYIIKPESTIDMPSFDVIDDDFASFISDDSLGSTALFATSTTVAPVSLSVTLPEAMQSTATHTVCTRMDGAKRTIILTPRIATNGMSSVMTAINGTGVNINHVLNSKVKIQPKPMTTTSTVSLAAPLIAAGL